MEAWWAAAGGVVGLVFLELLKAALSRGRDEALKRASSEVYQAQKLADCLEKTETLTEQRDVWREKYFELLREKNDE